MAAMRPAAGGVVPVASMVVLLKPVGARFAIGLRARLG
jgi:hypothetical protein